SMSQARRAASAVGNALVWTGPNVTRFGAGYLVRRARLDVSAPSSVAGNYAIGTAEFGGDLAGITGAVVTTAPVDGCTAIASSAVRGNVALIDRGTCAFTVKAKNAQDAGAIAVIIANNTTGIFNMTGD